MKQAVAGGSPPVTASFFVCPVRLSTMKPWMETFALMSGNRRYEEKITRQGGKLSGHRRKIE